MFECVLRPVCTIRRVTFAGIRLDVPLMSPGVAVVQHSVGSTVVPRSQGLGGYEMVRAQPPESFEGGAGTIAATLVGSGGSMLATW